MLGACDGPQAEPGAPPATAGTLWHSLGTWSGRGDRQTESFDITSGSMRLAWDAVDEGEQGPRRLRVSLHSSISGRPLETVVDSRGAGTDTALVTAGPRVAYLLIESEGVHWHVTLEEAVPGR